MHFEAFTFVLTAGCWPLQSVSSSFKPPAPIEDYVVSFLDFYGEVIVVELVFFVRFLMPGWRFIRFDVCSRALRVLLVGVLGAL